MKKLIFVCALCCALFSACQKDCEKDKTTTISVTNPTESAATFFYQSDSRVIYPGKTSTFDIPMPETFHGSKTIQTSFTYRFDHIAGNRSVSAWLTVCQTTQITLTE